MAKKKESSSQYNSTWLIGMVLVALIGGGYLGVDGCNGEEEDQTEQTDPANEDRPGAVRKK